MTPRRAEAQGGFTLIELMISLGLFAAIAVAGLALVQGILNVQGRTELRMDRLAQVQRTMFVVASDLEQIAAGQVAGEGAELRFTRLAPGAGGPKVAMHYAVAGGALVRTADARLQVLLPGVAEARWRFLDGGAWVDRWPVDETRTDRWPRAVELQMQVGGADGPAGTLRRLVVLPAQGEPPQPPAQEPAP